MTETKYGYLSMYNKFFLILDYAKCTGLTEKFT